MEVTLFAGPAPAFVLALILKVYEVYGVRSVISAELVSASSISIEYVELESDFVTSIIYPVMTPFCLSFGTGVHVSFAVVPCS